jgi:hypothetical protein
MNTMQIWQQYWDPAVGLWWRAGAGHTPPVKDAARVHPLPDAASRLLVAAQAGRLAEVDAAAVLRAMRDAQTADGPFQGVPTWYAEEPYLSDSNAAFFTGISLLVLWQAHGDQLDDTCRGLLREIFQGLSVWFIHSLDEKAYYYPNKTLGDLVCAWLLVEILDLQEHAAHAEDVMLQAADYWQRHAWGWGEHLSDIYARVMLNQLSVLLLLAEKLPAAVRAAYTALFRDLLALEDAFQGGPRVPSFRSYAFLESPTHTHYRELIVPLPDDLEAMEINNDAPVGATLHARGWHDFAGPRAPRVPDLAIPCFGGVVSHARVEDGIRLGSVSRVPLMPSAEHLLWGMSWMCFPAVFWRPAGDWGFLQWATREDGQDHSHPETQVWSYVGQSLTQRVLPPMVGRTWTIQRGRNLLALRVMPAVPASWESLCDRFRLIDGSAEMIEYPATAPLASVTVTTPGRAVHHEAPVARWAQLALRYPDMTVSVQCLPLCGDDAPALTALFPNTHEWERRLDGEALRDRRMLVTLWGISLDGPVTNAPILERAFDHLDVPRSLEERPWRVRWAWPGIDWDVVIDPLSGEALRES